MMNTRKRFAISERFNVEVLRIVESGFVEKWLKVYRELTQLYEVRPKHPPDTDTPLTMKDLFPIFCLWIVGICISCCAFVAEIIVDRRLKRKA